MNSIRRRTWLLVLITALLSIAIGALGMSWWRTRPRQVVDAYHIWFHRQGETTYNNTRWLGTSVQKCPLDLFVLQEIISEIKPDVLVETGTYRGAVPPSMHRCLT